MREIIIESSGDVASDHLLESLVQNAIRKLVLPHGGLDIPGAGIYFPSREIGAVIFLSEAYDAVEKFFHEIITRGLFLGQQISFIRFYFVRFSLHADSKRKLAFCEGRFVCVEQDEMLERFRLLEPEILLGASSSYQGGRILEYRSASSVEKSALVHERISSLVYRRPRDFHYDVFSFLQQFFANCKAEFLQVREVAYITRLVGVMYLYHRTLKKSVEEGDQRRHIHFKCMRGKLQLAFGVRSSLGVFVALHFLNPHEVFEERHLMQAIKNFLPGVVAVEGSSLFMLYKEEKNLLLYLEVEKEDGGSFAIAELKELQAGLALTLENCIEKLMPKVFMPRNEEEVMKNILLLSRQLKYIRDIPQCFISFEEQTEQRLTFTVVLVRILLGRRSTIKEMFCLAQSEMLFIEDRTKKVGLLRGKYVKEATVFRLKVDKFSYLRPDHSVDLLQARQDIVREIQRVIGDFRDYNGGMIASHIDNFYALKKLFPISIKRGDPDLESFFHSIFPVELRGVVAPLVLKYFYNMLCELSQKECSSDRILRVEERRLFAIFRFNHFADEVKLTEIIRSIGLSASQVLVFSSKKQELFYMGYILLNMSADMCLLCQEKFGEVAFLEPEVVSSHSFESRNFYE